MILDILTYRGKHFLKLKRLEEGLNIDGSSLRRTTKKHYVKNHSVASAHIHDATMFVIFYDLCDYECKYSKEITLEDLH